MWPSGLTRPPARGRDGSESPRRRCPFLPRAVEFECHAYEIAMSFRTLLTPGAFQAAVPAATFSPHERTLPDSVTVPPSAATFTFPASI